MRIYFCEIIIKIDLKKQLSLYQFKINLMLEKEIFTIKKKRKIYKKKYIGIILLYHFSPSLLKRKKKSKIKKIQEDTKSKTEIINEKFNTKQGKDRHKHCNSIKINVTRLLLKDDKCFFTIDYIDNYDIVKGVRDELNINRKYINKYYILSKKEFDIYIVDINKDIKLDSDSIYNWRTYMDFYKEDEDFDINDIYKSILDSNSLNIVTDRYMLKNSHIDNYLCTDNDINRNIIKIRKIYSKLVGVAKYSKKNPQSKI